LYDWIKHPW